MPRRDSSTCARPLGEGVVGLVQRQNAPCGQRCRDGAPFKGRPKAAVATTVIEVWRDVPNASIIVIERAEKLLVWHSLHQLRGRVGRGQAPLPVLLMYQAPAQRNRRQRSSST